MNQTGEAVLLSDADWLEFSPVIWRPETKDEKLAALIAYNTGDGSITDNLITPYAKNDGTKTKYKRLGSAFYSNVKVDLDEILKDAKVVGLSTNASVTLKKNNGIRENGYQLQLGKSGTETLIAFGAPIGKKTAIEFSVPDWILNGENGVKRAYIASLFGAEGTTPSRSKSGKSRLPRQPVISMCKLDNNSFSDFFNQLKGILFDLGVTSTVTVGRKKFIFNKNYTTWHLYIDSGLNNLISFFDNVGFNYCASKRLLAWQWSKYLKAYRAESQRRRHIVISMKSDGNTYEAIGKQIGLTKGAAHRLIQSIEAGSETTAGHSFPHFSEWLCERWSEKRQLLKLNICNKLFREKPVEVWNMLVSSEDHSYLLASGANNFNSFETMSGRVYYPFDRKTHVKSCAFNPSLPIWVGQDFNLNPMSSVIMQPQSNGDVWIVDEIVLKGSNTDEVCSELDKRYWRNQKQVIIYPDPAGQYGQHARGESDLDIFRERGFGRQRFHRKHPLIADRVNAVNRMLQSADGKVRLFVDHKCRTIINSLEQTIYKMGSREVDKTADIEHSADALGYCIHFEYPVRKIEIMGVSI